MRLRIAAAAVAGVVLIGVWGWPLAAPTEPNGAVLAAAMTTSARIYLVAMSFLAGLIAYFLSWPYGRQIGVLAVPSGLAIWAFRSGDMAGLILLNPTAEQRQLLFAALKWEPFFWLVVVVIGFLGVLTAQKLTGRKVNTIEDERKSGSKLNIYLSGTIAVVSSILIAPFCIRIFAQDVRMFDSKLGSVVAQPAAAQIVFAVLVSFGLAAFIAKKFLNADYICPVIATAFVPFFVISVYVKPDVLQHLARSWPLVFSPDAVTAILPIQSVAFGTLGSIAGYWMAVRYNYWRKHEMR